MISRNYTHLIIPLIILVCAIALRSIHIDADTPSGLSWSAGLYVDEGYKTLSPRNLILFGGTHWHTADSYPGWMNDSPVTQWSVYAAFKAFGTNISSARIVPIIYFFLLVLLYIFFMRRRYTTKLFYLGLALLTTDITLFTFSRVALFEIPMSFFLYAMILPLSLINEAKKTSILPITGLMVGAVIIAYTVKLSVLIYISPVLAAASIIYITTNNISNKQAALFASALIAIISVVLTLSYNTWSARIDISLQGYIYSVIENPLLLTSPLIIIAGTLCAAHAVAYQSDIYFNNLFRLSLVCMAISAPLLLSIFSYHPLRYFTPFVPAYILLILEWLSTTTSNTKKLSFSIILYTSGILILSLAIMYMFVTLKLHEHVQVRHLIIINVIIVAALWAFRRHVFSIRASKLVITSLVTLSILHNTYFISSFIVSPSYQANKIRTQLTSLVKDDEIISGGWAPFLTLGTPIKTLYADINFNPTSVLKIIEPDYFLLSETPTALKTFDLIKEDKNIIAGSPLHLGTYNKTNVRMYPLTYNK